MAVKKTNEAPRELLLPLPAALAAFHRPWLENWMKHWREDGHVAPVLLLTGPAGSGKREIAYWLSQWMLCERNGPRALNSLFGASTAPLEPCGDCLACLKARRSSWVDFSEIAPDESRTLKLEEFKKLRSTLGFGAFDGNYRITLIREADRMTPQAANSLLKMLEEPPPEFVFILTAADSSLLLPTLVSRCQRIRLLPLSETVLLEILTPEARKNGVSDSDLARSIRTARGNLHRARTALNPEYWERRKQLLRFLSTPWSELEALLSLSTRESADVDLLLDHLENLAHEFAQWACSPEALENNLTSLDREIRPYITDTVRKGGVPAARDFWLERAERAFQGRFDSTLPLNRKLLVQEILLPWAAGPRA